MAMLRFGNAALATPIVDPFKWVEKKVPAGRVKVARNVIAKYDPSKWLLSHSTIIASVDTDLADPSDKKSNYLIKPEHSVFVNNNGDSWERELLKATYKTFLGADNFCEHVQIPELSKGKVIDVALREVPIGKDIEGKDLTTLYVDILVATNRSHVDLVEKIKCGDYSAMSMGCLIAYSFCSQCGNKAEDESKLCKHIRYFKRNYFIDKNGARRIIAELCFTPEHKVLLSDGSYKLIEGVEKGFEVITHKGLIKKVNDVMQREYSGDIIKIKSEGSSKDLETTPEHPHYIYDKDKNIFVFKKAKDIEIGDSLLSITPDVEESISDINEDRAWLLGLYAAEGFVYKGNSENSCGVEFVLNAEDEINLAEKICEKLEKEFPPEPKKNGCKGSYKNWIELLKNKNRINYSNYFENTGIFCRSCGAPEYYLDPCKFGKKYRCKLCRSRANVDRTYVKPIIYLFNRKGKDHFIGDRLIVKKSKKLVIIYYNKDCFDFFKKYCIGDRSFNKKLNKDILYAKKNIQKKVLVGWLIGDGSIDSELRLRGYTTSEQLFRNFEFISNRLNYWTRSQVVFDDKLIELGDLRKLDDTLDRNNCHPRYTLYFSPRDCGDLSVEVGYVNEYPIKQEEKRKINRYLLHKVTNIITYPYTGFVYNISVEDDNSYIVDGLITHNCGSADDPGSCKFIDASWVKKPAFGGALLRNLVEPNDDISEKLNQAMLVPSFQPQPGMLLRAASQAAASLVNEIQAQDEPKDAPLKEPEEPKEPAKDDTDFPAAPEGDAPLGLDEPAAEAPAGEGAAPEIPVAPEPQIQEPAEDATVKEVEQLFTKNILNKIRRKLLKDEAGLKTPPDEKPIETESTNDNLIKKASKVDLIKLAKMSGNERLLNGFLILSNAKNWNSLKKYGYGREDVIGMLHFIDKNMSSEPIGTDAVLALSKIKTASTNPQSFFTDMIIEIGRQPSVKEGCKLIKWAKILSKL